MWHRYVQNSREGIETSPFLDELENSETRGIDLAETFLVHQGEYRSGMLGGVIGNPRGSYCSNKP